MFEGITIGQYIPGNSLLHQMDPRGKILSVMAIILAILTANRWLAYIVLTIITIVAIACSGIPLRAVWRSLRLLWAILLITFLLQVFFTPGEVVWVLGPLNITREGLALGAQVLWRLVLLVIVSSLLTLTTTPLNMTFGLEYLLSPFKRVGLPASELAMMMTIALRFVPTLLEEARLVMKAQQSRGANFTSGSLMNRVRSMVPLLVPLFAGAFRRAEDLATAMEARCYQGGANRTRMNSLKFSVRDYGLSALCGATLVVTVAIRLWK